MARSTGLLSSAALQRSRSLWRDAQFDTSPANRAEAESGIRLAYQLSGLAAPDAIVWCESPLAMERLRRGSWLANTAGDCVKRDLIDTPLAAAFNRLGSLPPDTYGRLLTGFDMRPRLSSIGQDCVIGAVDGLRWGYSASLRLLMQGWQRYTRYRQFADSSWGPFDLRDGLGLTQFAHDTLGYRSEFGALRGLWQIALNGGWLAPHRNICWISDRWATCAIDAAGRPHAEHGPAIAFRDGWRRYFWKGVEVPSWMIETKHRISPLSIDQQRDPFVRRCMIEIITPRAYIESGVPRMVATDATGRLWQRRWSMTDIWAAVEVVNGTKGPDGRFAHYFLQVPGHLRKPVEAVAWTYGMTVEQYAGLSRRT